MDVEQAIREYLPNVLHMSLATSANGKPWVCEVLFVYDDDLNLYWRSLPNTRHSQEVAANPNVAGNIVKQHGPGDKPHGVYFEGTAEMLTGVTQDSPAYKLYAERFNRGPEMLESAAKPTGYQFYKVNVADWYVFDMRTSNAEEKHHLDR